MIYIKIFHKSKNLLIQIKYMIKMKKVFHVSILILLSIQNIEENSTYEQNEKKWDLLSLIKSINLTNENSFFSKNFDDNFENNSENGIKIVYLKKDEIPKI